MGRWVRLVGKTETESIEQKRTEQKRRGKKNAFIHEPWHSTIVCGVCECPKSALGSMLLFCFFFCCCNFWMSSWLLAIFHSRFGIFGIILLIFMFVRVRVFSLVHGKLFLFYFLLCWFSLLYWLALRFPFAHCLADQLIGRERAPLLLILIDFSDYYLCVALTTVKLAWHGRNGEWKVRNNKINTKNGMQCVHSAIWL